MLSTREGYYTDKNGKRVYFTTTANGIDAKRQVSKVLMRAAILLLVIAGMGYRRVAWLMEVLFHVDTSKFSLQRWVGAVASDLPNGDEIVFEAKVFEKNFCLESYSMKKSQSTNVIWMRYFLVASINVCLLLKMSTDEF